MTSAIDSSKPITGTPTTQSVRDNFAAAKSEIETLQARLQVSKFVIVGTLALLTGTPRWYPDRSVTISSVYFSLGTAGTATIDVLKNGASIFSGSKPQTTAANKSSIISVSVAMTTSDYLTVSVNTAGGADATVYIVYS